MPDNKICPQCNKPFTDSNRWDIYNLNGYDKVLHHDCVEEMFPELKGFADVKETDNKIRCKKYHCPTCNSILGESMDGIFIRTRAGELSAWGKDLHILLTCHNEKPGHVYEQHTRMILVKLPDESFEFLPYEQYLTERIEGKRTN